MKYRADCEWFLPILRAGTAVGLSVLVFAGCGRAPVASYEVPKEQPRVASPHRADPHGADPHGGMTPRMPKLTYALPSGWQEAPSGGMRAASFTVPGKDGQSAEVAVIPLPSAAGQDADIFNFWRSEVKLPPVAIEELSQLLKFTDIGTQTGQLMDAVSTEPLLDGKFKKRLLVAVLNLSGMRWNFRMTGSDELVAAQKPAFVGFLKTVAFEAPEVPAMVTTADPAGAGPALPDWQVPSDWKSQPPGQMLLATFVIADEKLGKATVTVSSFPGDVGGVLANVNRWRTQVGVKPLEASALEKELTTFDANGLKWIMAEVLGTVASNGNSRPTRLIGALTPRGGETWFFKMMGDDAIAAQQREAFLKFVKSVTFDKPTTATTTGSQPDTAAPASNPAAAAKAAGFADWSIPAHWKSQPPGQMLLATFAIEDSSGKATMTVSSFPGDVGGVLANLNRWRGQVGLGPVEAAALDKETTQLDLPAGKAVLVDATGQKRIVGAMLPHDGQTWYFKLLGDPAVAGKEKEAFLTFLKSLKFDHAH